jgi:hypothetical protein
MIPRVKFKVVKTWCKDQRHQDSIEAREGKMILVHTFGVI